MRVSQHVRQLLTVFPLYEIMAGTQKSIVYIVDDDDLVRQTMVAMTTALDFNVRSFASGIEFLEAQPELTEGALLLDVRMPRVDGLAVLEQVKQHWANAPVIMMSGQGDIPMAVRAMRSGASDFVEKPVSVETMRSALESALERQRTSISPAATLEGHGNPLNLLSEREAEVFMLLVRGDQNKQVANKLGISHRTVEVHRARIMKRLEVTTIAQMVKMAIHAGLNLTD